LLVPEIGVNLRPGSISDEVPIVFLSEDEVLPHLKPGATFTLWEGKTIGTGTVLRIDD
jgi:hypothetical protein